jgi:hypothetical protein
MDVLLTKPCTRRQMVAQIARLTSNEGEGIGEGGGGVGVGGEKGGGEEGDAREGDGRETVVLTDAAEYRGLDRGKMNASADSAAENEECPLDLQLGVRCMGSMKDYRELVQCFKVTLPHSLRSIEEAYQTEVGALTRMQPLPACSPYPHAPCFTWLLDLPTVRLLTRLLSAGYGPTLP